MSGQPQLFEGAAPLEKHALATVLDFIKKRNLKETEEALKKELGISASTISPASGQLPFSVTAGIHSVEIDPEKLDESYSRMMEFIEKSLDMYKHELSLLLYPVFVHLYLEMVSAGHSHQAQRFFCRYHGKQESYFSEDLIRIKSITLPEHLVNHELVDAFRRDKYTIRISSDSLHPLIKHLQSNQHTAILDIIKRHVLLDEFDGTPRGHLDITSSIGALSGETTSKVNKTKVLHGIPRDPDVAAALAELEMEEEANNNEPKKKKPKKDALLGRKGKVAAPPNAPTPNRLPLPPLRENEQLCKRQAFKDATKCISLSASVLPSICFYTVLHTHSGLNALSFSDDSTLLAGAFQDSAIRLWTLTSRKLCGLKATGQLQQMTLTAEDILERIVDITSASDMKTLLGHSGPVYSASFNPDNSFLLSSSEDGTVRLWSLQTFTALVCFKGHNYPVWGVEFCPQGFYFASCSHDRTARVWSTDHIQPLRVLAGHSSDVDCCHFHPNINYLATGSSDRSIRVWDLDKGHCVRIFTGHKGPVFCLTFSPDGKYLASGGADKRVMVWDFSAGVQLASFMGHSKAVHQLAFSRDSAILASGGLDNCVKIWDISDGACRDRPSHESLLGSYPTKNTPVHCLHFTRKNLLLAAGPFAG